MKLERAIELKAANGNWLYDCTEGKHNSFPYRVAERTPRLHRLDYVSVADIPLLPHGGGDAPFYVVNIPVGHLPGGTSHRKILRLIKLLRDQAFGTCKEASRAHGMRRLAVVIGLNQVQSLDPALNRSFIDFSTSIPRVEGIAYRVFAFMWIPTWSVHGDRLENLYKSRKAFRVLKYLAPETAAAVRRKFESTEKGLNPPLRKLIPFRLIRERILGSPGTRAFVRHLTDSSPDAPLYYGVMDGDCRKLRKRVGLLSRLDQKIESYGPRSALSLGYSVQTKYPLLNLAVEIDMAVRNAMNSVFPYGPYFPEPASFFCCRKPGEESTFEQLTFAAKGTQTLESRRLIQNGLAAGILSQDALFIADGGVLTTAPIRMFSKTLTFTTELTTKILRQKRCLKALRGLAQTHATPKQWADNLYVALGYKASLVTDVTTPMMNLYKVYDPINRAFSQVGRWCADHITRVLDTYGEPLPMPLAELRLEAMTKLTDRKMERALVERIDLAARRSGQAIATILTRTFTALEG